MSLVSRDKLSSFTTKEKMQYILGKVREGDIVILEEGLDPEEETKLIQSTMTEIDNEEFSGIEIESYPSEESRDSLFKKILGIGKNKKRNRLTVVGPADKLRTVKKKKDIIEALVRIKD
ncbi:MAG: hypothetical protein BTN85_0686 [Candidatus Methanohalarchaeum thermophilum]|uniref:DUF2073 domain-containing protein n=1 Tax=Methanohalarchaeum thermophilum TaxID=1903181 RepID=A0A1Q6DUZ1_METT1|nr:MAG: hypothetical protein BTN85_0686 [Candidatus Methanohalarchaeum thermophilum]